MSFQTFYILSFCRNNFWNSVGLITVWISLPSELCWWMATHILHLWYVFTLTKSVYSKNLFRDRQSGLFAYSPIGTGCLLWCIAWFYIAYDTPAEHPRITEEEKDYIMSRVGHGVYRKVNEVPDSSNAR